MVEANVTEVESAPGETTRKAPASEAARPRDGGAEGEQALASAMKIGLPAVTVVSAVIVGVIFGVPMAILVLAAGVLLGVIALFWASLRVLSGETELSPELLALEAAASGSDALVSRKAMLLRALKDLENERDVGKLEEDDFASLSATYREELKVVLRKIDASLEPHRKKAEAAIEAHLARLGREDASPSEDRSAGTSRADERFVDPDKTERSATNDKLPRARVGCPKCQASNEPDARFCKGCGGPLTEATPSEERPVDPKNEESAS